MNISTKIIFSGALLCCGLANAFTPQTGMWAVTNELNGKPGRGFNIDVQNATLVLQVYAYERDGTPTFYLSSGQLNDNNYSGQLMQYRGGRSFGGADQSGTEAGNAGTVTMRFVSGIKGYITFPGEPEREISRFGFAYSETPQSLLGTWSYLAANPSNGTYTATFGDMTTISGDTAFSANGTFACRYTKLAAGDVACAQSANGQVTATVRFTLSVNDGEGFSGFNSGPMIFPTTVRRLTNIGGVGTGLVVKSAPVTPEENMRLLDAALTSVVAGFAMAQ